MHQQTNKALVIFSGGQDSTTCLLKAIDEYGKENVETISFYYGQRHQIELEKAAFIAKDLGVLQTLIDLSVIGEVTTNALLDKSLMIKQEGDKEYPNSFVDGRNALFLLFAAIRAKQQGIHDIIIGVCETDYSGYPDCREIFIKSMNNTLNLAMDFNFNIITPLMYLNKVETWALADQLGYLDYINRYTYTCYLGDKNSCGQCPSCLLRQNSMQSYLQQKSSKLV